MSHKSSWFLCSRLYMAGSTKAARLCNKAARFVSPRSSKPCRSRCSPPLHRISWHRSSTRWLPRTVRRNANCLNAYWAWSWESRLDSNRFTTRPSQWYLTLRRTASWSGMPAKWPSTWFTRSVSFCPRHWRPPIRKSVSCSTHVALTRLNLSEKRLCWPLICSSKWAIHVAT